MIKDADSLLRLLAAPQLILMGRSIGTYAWKALAVGGKSEVCSHLFGARGGH